MKHLDGVVSGPRPGRMRHRRGRPPRGPMSLPGPLTPNGVPSHHHPRSAFDLLATHVITALDRHFAVEPHRVEIVVEDVPLIGPEWHDQVPASNVFVGSDATRIVLYRLPISHRAATAAQLNEAVWRILLDRLGEVWHISPDDLDPRR